MKGFYWSASVLVSLATLRSLYNAMSGWFLRAAAQPMAVCKLLANLLSFHKYVDIMDIDKVSKPETGSRLPQLTEQCDPKAHCFTH